MLKEEQTYLLERYLQAMTKNKIPVIVQKANLKDMKQWIKSGKKNQEDYARMVIKSAEDHFNRKQERKKARGPHRKKL